MSVLSPRATRTGDAARRTTCPASIASAYRSSAAPPALARHQPAPGARQAHLRFPVRSSRTISPIRLATDPNHVSPVRHGISEQNRSTIGATSSAVQTILTPRRNTKPPSPASNRPRAGITGWLIRARSAPAQRDDRASRPGQPRSRDQLAATRHRNRLNPIVDATLARGRWLLLCRLGS